MVDTIAERYGMLPSEVMHRATTFDVFICDAAASYRQSVERAARDRTRDPQSFSQDELLKILKETRGENNT